MHFFLACVFFHASDVLALRIAKDIGKKLNTSIAVLAEPVNVLHIAKTAGTSLGHDLGLHLGVHRKGWNDERCYPTQKGQTLLTFVRKPAAHVYSQWLHCRDNKDHWFNPQHLPGSLHEWLQHWVSVGDKARAAHEPNESFNCYLPMNLQSRILSCKFQGRLKYTTPGLDNRILSDMKKDFEEDLDLALQHLKGMYAVGITDFYQESLCVLHVRDKSEYPDYCDCDHPAWKSFPQTQINHGGRPHGAYTVEVNADDMELIHQLTKHDSQIYTLALERLRQDISEIEGKWKKRMWCHSKNSNDLFQEHLGSTSITLFDWD